MMTSTLMISLQEIKNIHNRNQERESLIQNGPALVLFIWKENECRSVMCLK